MVDRPGNAPGTPSVQATGEPLLSAQEMERVMGVEPTVVSLEGCCLTPRRHPRSGAIAGHRPQPPRVQAGALGRRATMAGGARPGTCAPHRRITNAVPRCLGLTGKLEPLPVSKPARVFTKHDQVPTRGRMVWDAGVAPATSRIPTGNATTRTRPS
jgi:hypothetical protein